MSGKTYRVPKKVHEAARSALTTVGVADLNPGPSIQVAQALASGMPVDQKVLFAIHDFFFSWIRGSMTASEAMLHGGKNGKEWANRSIALTVLPLTAAGSEAETVEDASFEEIFDLSDDEYDALIEFGNELAGAAGVDTTIPKPGDETLAMGEPVAPDTETDAVDELGEHVETALGLATQLDQTIEKLALALEEALAEEEDEPYDEEAEAAEMSMVQGALAEVDADGADDADFAVLAAEARERVAAAALARERSLAMAKMASARLTLQAEGPASGGPVADAVAEKVAGPPADAGPKAPSGEHHASRQVRDWHGRFAKAGGRVRSESGNLGYIKKVDDNGQLVITGDDGKEHTVDPKTVEVISKKSPARLPEPMELVEDPKARTDSYLEWAQDQMGATPK